MASAPPDEDVPETDDDVEACRIALEAALEKGVSFCETTDSRLEVLGQIVGIDGSDLDPATALGEGPGTGAADRETRAWVLARAEELIDDSTEEPLDAINRAWSEASEEMTAAAEQGPDHDEAPDEDAAEGDDADEGADESDDEIAAEIDSDADESDAAEVAADE